MNIVLIVQILLFVIIVVGFVTQVCLPLMRGTPVFPMLREEGKLLGLWSMAKEESLNRNIKKEIEDEQLKQSKPGD